MLFTTFGLVSRFSVLSRMPFKEIDGEMKVVTSTYWVTTYMDKYPTAQPRAVETNHGKAIYRNQR